MHLQDPHPPPEPKSSPKMVLRAPRRCVESNSGVTLAYVIYWIHRVRTLSQADGCTYIGIIWTAGPLRPEADVGCRLPRAGQEMRRKLFQRTLRCIHFPIHEATTAPLKVFGAGSHVVSPAVQPLLDKLPLGIELSLGSGVVTLT